VFDLASAHSCCQPSTTVVSLPVLSAVKTKCETWNLFTIVFHCVDDAIVKQEAGQLLFTVPNSCVSSYSFQFIFNFIFHKTNHLWFAISSTSFSPVRKRLQNVCSFSDSFTPSSSSDNFVVLLSVGPQKWK